MPSLNRTTTSLVLIIMLTGCHNMTHHSIGSDATEAHRANDYGMRDPATNARAADMLLATDDLPTTLAGIDQAIGITKHNLQNAETTAFRGRRVISVEGQLPHFGVDVEQGALERTGRELDLGISGNGFFCMKIPGRGKGFLAYTRNGNFFRNQSGEITSSDGLLLQPSIIVPNGATDITVAEDGTITGMNPGSAERSYIGVIKLYRFEHPDRLGQPDSGLLSANASSGAAIEVKTGDPAAASLLQNFLERSNVDVYRERQRLGVLKSLRVSLLHIIDAD